jgi:tetratricopeptide (TPR) repeat protein
MKSPPNRMRVTVRPLESLPAKMAAFPAKQWYVGTLGPKLGGMRVPVLLVTIAGMFLSTALRAQEPVSTAVMRAHQLQNQGQPKAAIRILEPLVQTDVQALSDTELGVVWNLLGSSYQDLEMYDKARWSYETAVQKLRPILTAQSEYAAALDNLGTLESSLGQLESSKTLCEKARRIYEELGDHKGIAIASSNLAWITLAQKDFKTARRSLARSLAEAQRTTALRDDDVVSLDSVKGLLAEHAGQYREAISDFQQSIELWTRAHGPNGYVLGAAYGFRAQAFAKSGDYARAHSDAEHALAILEAARGKNSLFYLKIEMLYAQILRVSGAREQASRLTREAGSALADLQARQCGGGCTISVEGFR